MSTGMRLPRRRWPRVAVAAASLASLGVGLKLATMFWFASSGAAAFHDGRLEASESDYARLETFNIVDPARAHVGVGVARYRQGDLEGAESAFAHALELEPDDCEIRFDLAVTIEAEGDELVAAGPPEPQAPGEPFDPSAQPYNPVGRYNAALEVAQGATCEMVEPDDVGDRLAATRDRIEAKLRVLQPRSRDDLGINPDDPLNSRRGDSEEINKLDDKNDRGASQREAGRDEDRRGILPVDQSNW